MRVRNRGAWLLGIAVLAGSRLRRRPEISWAQRVVLIAGGSRGLGLELARELVAGGAMVALIARDGDRLEEVAQELRDSGGDVLTIPADVGAPDQAREAVERAVAWHGHLDALINTAGVLQVAPLETLSLEDFRTAVDVMLWGPVHCTLAALPALERSDVGRVATVTSIGGKVPVPHLLPYAVAKHAVVGFSESLRAELGPSGPRVVTVVPGFMRTGSHIHALVKGSHEAEYRWFAAFAQMPLFSQPTDRAAQRILAGIARGDAHVSNVWWAPFAARLHGIAPGLVSRIAGLISPLLPEAGDDVSPVGESVDEGAEQWRAGHEIGAGLGPLSGRAERTVAEHHQEPEGGSR